VQTSGLVKRIVRRLSGDPPAEKTVQIFNKVIAAFCRGVDFIHVLLLLRDPNRHTMQARISLGEDASALVARFGFTCEDALDIFNEAARKGREFIVLDVNAARYGGLHPRLVPHAGQSTLRPAVSGDRQQGLHRDALRRQSRRTNAAQRTGP
jgi:hypothetical protein